MLTSAAKRNTTKENMKHYQEYIQILNNELAVAMGCTEPIAIAYCASLVKDHLGCLPTSVEVVVSGNIIKNVKSVVVPNTNKSTGISTAVAIGLIAGDSSAKLEVIANVTKEQAANLPSFLATTPINIVPAQNDHTLYIEIVGKSATDTVKVVIADAHTHVVLIEKNGNVLYKIEQKVQFHQVEVDKSILNVADIVQFANQVKIDDVFKTLNRQIRYNMAIAREGIANHYGANIGKTLLHYGCGDVLTYCKALASAASDARMNGCEMPVVINSGSGNQGITCSVPVVAYAEKLRKEEERLYRALVVSNLITIHIKNSIGKLSAFCGVVIAGVGAGAGICYLEGGNENDIAHTIVNALAIISGVVCDGAKSSCAAKIASSVEAGLLGYYMHLDGNQFVGGEGIVKKGVENTIKAVGTLARVGMCETDKEILHIMLEG
ncbi:MAG: serine dehydratase subunit alpha family protein [Clostridia bacterium]|nr:serine dehydratase subunit alpha family protein [Clostridia bacterium]